jgi:hypothetical protein
MNVIRTMCCGAALAVVAGCANSRDWYQYGARFPAADDVQTVAEIDGDERNVIVEGTIGEVCKTMGCWLTLRDGNGHELFVLLKDHAFFVPRNAAGRTARMHGWAERAEVGVDQLQHFAMDAGKTAQEIAAIDKPIERITFHADSVIILGEGLELAEPPVVR